MSDKVVSIDQLKERRAKRETARQNYPEVADEMQLPPYVEEQLADDNEKVLHIFKKLDEVLREHYRQTERDPLLIPVEALARLISGALGTFDQFLPEGAQLERAEIRTELSDMMMELIDLDITERQMMGQAVYEHDVLLSLMATFLSYLFQYRVLQIQRRNEGRDVNVTADFADYPSKGQEPDLQRDRSE